MMFTFPRRCAVLALLFSCCMLLTSGDETIVTEGVSQPNRNESKSKGFSYKFKQEGDSLCNQVGANCNPQSPYLTRRGE